MRKLVILSPEEIEKQYQELGTSTAEVNKKWEERFNEAERFAKELGFKSLEDMPPRHEEFEAHMDRFSFQTKP